MYLSKLLEGDFVFKEYIWDSEYALEDYEFMRMDAIVAERLYWSPRIVDIYAFCGLGMINEAMQNGDMEHIAVPTGNGRSSSYEGIENSSTLKVYNTLAGTQKLEYALDMAEVCIVCSSNICMVPTTSAAWNSSPRWFILFSLGRLLHRPSSFSIHILTELLFMMVSKSRLPLTEVWMDRLS